MDLEMRRGAARAASERVVVSDANIQVGPALLTIWSKM
jgi:hypothetical protein